MKEAKVVAVKACKGGNGSTTLAYLLSRVSASLGHKTAIMDLDLTSYGNLSIIFDSSPEFGIQIAASRGRISSDDFKKVSNELFFLSCPVTPDTSEILNQALIMDLISSSAKIFDLIVLDLPSKFYPKDSIFYYQLMELADVNILISDFSLSSMFLLQKFVCYSRKIIAMENCKLALNKKDGKAEVGAQDFYSIVDLPIQFVIDRIAHLNSDVESGLFPRRIKKSAISKSISLFLMNLFKGSAEVPSSSDGEFKR
jgi:hypothetical protein